MESYICNDYRIKYKVSTFNSNCILIHFLTHLYHKNDFSFTITHNFTISQHPIQFHQSKFLLQDLIYS